MGKIQFRSTFNGLWQNCGEMASDTKLVSLQNLNRS